MCSGVGGGILHAACLAAKRGGVLLGLMTGPFFLLTSVVNVCDFDVFCQGHFLLKEGNVTCTLHITKTSHEKHV